MRAVVREKLLKPEALAYQALDAGFVKQIVGEFFIREHGECGALGAGGEFGGFFDGKGRVLADNGRDHAHHDLEAADAAGFVLRIGSLLSRVWIFLLV
jgi:hypothetical protein